MAKSRTAIDTIKGYYYQFDHFILKLLECENDNDSIIVEGIEDVDLTTADEITAIQCKYYAKTEYNHSVISQPLRYMMDHYLKSSNLPIKYKIYGYYNNGQDKLQLPVTLEYFKSHFIPLKAFNDLVVTDQQINDFLAVLEIDNNAKEFEEQENLIITKLKLMFCCNDFEAEYYYYNNALRIVQKKAIQPNVNDRSLSKKEFIYEINKKELLFNKWYLYKKGSDKYCSMIKKEYFTTLNTSPFERFFLLETDHDISITDIKSTVLIIMQKYSKVTNRTTTPYCPYLYFHNLTEQRLVDLKKALYNDNIKFIDGYDFKGSEFSIKSICNPSDMHNQVKLKIINSYDTINDILLNIQKTREVFQFFKEQPFWHMDSSSNRHIYIPFEKFEYISKII